MKCLVFIILLVCLIAGCVQSKKYSKEYHKNLLASRDKDDKHGKSKSLVSVDQNKDACFYVIIVLETVSLPILAQFLTPKSFQHGPKIGSAKYPASCVFLNAIHDLQKSIFGPT